MTEREFVKLLFDRYLNATGNDINIDEVGYYLEPFLISTSDDSFNIELTKRAAARVVNEFLINVLKIKDLDWQNAARIKDIYECKVCANSIAQAFRRCIIDTDEENVFNLNRNLSDKEIDKIIDKVMLIALHESPAVHA